MGVNVKTEYGPSGDPQQQGGEGRLTTNQGVPVSDNQNSLKSGSRGPTLLEDFVLREKIFHFDHERIPERIVHARGSGAHGYFEATEDISDLTKADVFKKGTKTPVFARFSTVAGGAGSVDTPRDVRGFSVKFYTKEGNWDLVGNDIPVFFIQDAIKFPDLIHSVKMEADRAFPQAGSAHDTFWDWASLMPETTHMQMWNMSDRGIPRSLRMMQGFGIHTFQLVNEKGEAHFVKFHFRPKLGVQSTLWDEAVKLQGADNDFHRKDLWMAIEAGLYPEWEFGIQVFDAEFANAQPYDVLDSTKIIPEEDVPVRIVGHMVLDRNPDNFFAETEQVAFCPSHVVPGIDFSDDPLLQGRLFSYLDTQKSRLGTSNFHQLPINQSKCPVQNFQRDGMMQMNVPKGRANYEPNSLNDAGEPTGPRVCPFSGFRTSAATTGPREHGEKLRARDERFADHYTQPRQHWRSLPAWEQTHMVNGFVFELSQVSLPQVPKRIVANLRNVDETLAARVAAGLGIELPEKVKPIREAVDVKPSPAVSITHNSRNTIEGRTIGILITNGSDKQQLEGLVKSIKDQKALPTIVAPRAHGIKLSDGSVISADGILAGTPSVVFDAVAVVLSEQGTQDVLGEVASVQWVQDAYAHLKAIGYTKSADALLKKAAIEVTEGVVDLTEGDFIKAAGTRYWDREPSVRALP
ncbi:hypothetical protein GLX27_002719 [Malassezia furfur]|uniref:Catalase n=1 Tax=Malassezia furfur TaxID=55194 RepID=A0ABY8ER60_MALFU|nr:katE [Malassezia furfur]WFD48052.1 hypothetical protein GLX27_002719 [Malassezia furfur]